MPVLLQQISMSQLVLLIRHKHSPLLSLPVPPSCPCSTLVLSLARTLDTAPSAITLLHHNLALPITDMSVSQCGIVDGTVIDVVITEQEGSDGFVVEVEYGSDRHQVRVAGGVTVGQMRAMVGEIVGLELGLFELMCGYYVLDEPGRALHQYGITQGSIIAVKRRILMDSLLNTHLQLRASNSVRSGSQNQDTTKQQPTPNVKILSYSHSCSASCNDLSQYQHPQPQRPAMKTSAMQLYHTAGTQEPQQTLMQKLAKIEDVKETISYGSLEEVKLEETDVEAEAEDGGRYYRFTCQLGCRLGAVVDKLARLEGVPLGRIKLRIQGQEGQLKGQYEGQYEGQQKGQQEMQQKHSEEQQNKVGDHSIQRYREFSLQQWSSHSVEGLVQGDGPLRLKFTLIGC